MSKLRKFHKKHENWWLVALAVIALIGLLIFARSTGRF